MDNDGSRQMITHHPLQPQHFFLSQLQEAIFCLIKKSVAEHAGGLAPHMSQY